MRVAAGVVLVAGVGYLGIERTADRSAVFSAPGATLDGARETRAEVADAISRDAVEPVAEPAESRVAGKGQKTIGAWRMTLRRLRRSHTAGIKQIK